MARAFKYLLFLLGGFVTLFVLAAVTLYLFFDPNDFREDISTAVKNQTGRDLTIEGDITLDIFPWLAVEVGRSSLGDSPGFGDAPMASFEKASFSVRLLPAILRQEIVVGAADIEALQLHLKIDNHGKSNWSDLIPEETASDPVESNSSTGSLDINSIEIINAMIRYTNDEAGETIVLDGLNLNVGRLQDDGSPVPLEVELGFDVQPAGLRGSMSLDTVLAFNVETGLLTFDELFVDGTIEGVASIPTTMSLESDRIEISTREYLITASPLEVSMLDMHMIADVQPFSYEDSVTPKATIAIDAFSPRTLMQLFDVAPPETADPIALSRVIVDATTELTATAIEMSNVTIKLDDTTFTGTLSVPRVPTGFYQFDLLGDSIELARYMEPPADADNAASADVAPMEIPVDLIKPLNARGSFKLAQASLGNIIFENIELGLNASAGKMRMFPISSEFFGGNYKGDVRIDVSGASPLLSMDEKISNVDLARLAKAMFDQDNVTGSIDGSFVLAGRGPDLAAIQRNLAGNMSMNMKDGSYTGTDVWYEIRRARALLKGEAPPEAVLPAKTDFSAVRMSAVVTDGVMQSDDLFAELPFMQLTGGGLVDIPEGTVDYSVMARIFERPEFLQGATAEELDELTEAVIPLTITGPLASPSIKPDLEKLLQKRVEDEVKDLLKDKLKGLFD
jgi:AsmA protein